MVNIYFSKTEDWVINPILALRASPLNTPENPLSLLGRASYIVQSEIVTRVIASATSIFAAFDCMVHAASCILKMDRAYSVFHLKQSARFLSIPLVGSAAAVVWPGILKYFLIGPNSPLSPGGEPDLSNTSTKVRQLWNSRKNKETFSEHWNEATLLDKRTIVQFLDHSPSSCKKQLVDVIYKKMFGRTDNAWPEQNSEPVFYHATSLNNFKGIIKSGKIEVRHEKVYRGAFVSTKPEVNFGRIVIVFKRCIERTSSLNHGFKMENAFWAGFSRDIPVNVQTIDRILINHAKSGEISSLKNFCKQYLNRDIHVSRYSSCVDGNRKLPIEWLPEDDSPDDSSIGNKKGAAIMKVMLIRVQQRKAQKAQKTLSKSSRTATKSQHLMMTC